jgi:hypothetical protein
MAQNTTVTLTADTWTQLTDADITSITFQVFGNNRVFIKATTDTTAPTNTTGAFIYQPGQGERNVAMSTLFPGISGADRLWAYAETSGNSVSFSHA